MKSKNNMKFFMIFLLALIAFFSLSYASDDIRQEAANNDEETEVITYIVKQGDTLWDISEAHYLTPWVWPKTWSNNDYIRNPHLIYPGQEIYIYTISSSSKIKAESISIQYFTGTPIDMVALDDYPPVLDVPMADNIGFISDKNEKGVGKLLVNHRETVAITTHDLVFVRLDDLLMTAPGDKFTLFRKDRYIKHPVTGKGIGYLYIITGHLTITKVRRNLAEGIIDKVADTIMAEDMLIPYEAKPKQLTLNIVQHEVKGFILTGMRDIIAMGTHEIVYLDKGTEDGLSPGDLINVIKFDRVPLKHHSYANIPAELKGKLVIYQTKKHTCAAGIIETTYDMNRGDEVTTKPL